MNMTVKKFKHKIKFSEDDTTDFLINSGSNVDSPTHFVQKSPGKDEYL